ncbi:hypothetical protein [Mesobacillus foraminis]|uniref:hypothetical protein n=1 Tax=Mesobacillus foraminis TaxID=279826 RepID=UPI0013049C75|nr:hypothetical protein [Mesobacillus foraminis]
MNSASHCQFGYVLDRLTIIIWMRFQAINRNIATSGGRGNFTAERALFRGKGQKIEAVEAEILMKRRIIGIERLQEALYC